MPEDWITTQEACEISGYNTEYMRRLIRKGKLKAKKISIVWVVDKTSLLEYISRNEDASDRRRGPTSWQPD